MQSHLAHGSAAPWDAPHRAPSIPLLSFFPCSLLPFAAPCCMNGSGPLSSPFLGLNWPDDCLTSCRTAPNWCLGSLLWRGWVLLPRVPLAVGNEQIFSVFTHLFILRLSHNSLQLQKSSTSHPSRNQSQAPHLRHHAEQHRVCSRELPAQRGHPRPRLVQRCCGPLQFSREPGELQGDGRVP